METLYKRQLRLVSLSKCSCWYKVLACANLISNDMCDRNIISDKFEIAESNTHESIIYVSYNTNYHICIPLHTPLAYWSMDRPGNSYRRGRLNTIDPL